MSPQLLVILPVYNEAERIDQVVGDWFHVLDEVVGDFVVLALDDGSTDDSAARLASLADTLGTRFETRSHSNRGHGQTCLEGYREACRRQIPYVFQIDSDGQCDPQYFPEVWSEREHCDVVYGVRVIRDDGFRRVVASLLLRWLVLLVAGSNCRDPNVPYRLMRTERIAAVLPRIGEHIDLANVVLASLLRKEKDIRTGYVPIRFRERLGGEPTVPLRRFGAKAIELAWHLRGL